MGTLVGFAGAIVGDGERFAGRGGGPTGFSRPSLRTVGESIEKSSEGRGAVPPLSLSLYTKGSAAGKLVEGAAQSAQIQRVGLRPGGAGEGEARSEANIPLDNCRYKRVLCVRKTPEVGYDGHTQERRTRARVTTAGWIRISPFSFADYFDPGHVQFPHAAGDERRPALRAAAVFPKHTRTATWRS